MTTLQRALDCAKNTPNLKTMAADDTAAVTGDKGTHGYFIYGFQDINEAVAFSVKFSGRTCRANWGERWKKCHIVTVAFDTFDTAELIKDLAPGLTVADWDTIRDLAEATGEHLYKDANGDFTEAYNEILRAKRRADVHEIVLLQDGLYFGIAKAYIMGFARAGAIMAYNGVYIPEDE